MRACVCWALGVMCLCVWFHSPVVVVVEVMMIICPHIHVSTTGHQPCTRMNGRLATQAEAPSEEADKDPDPMAYGRAPKGDEQAMDRLVEELAEREEGAFCVCVCVCVCEWVSLGGGVCWRGVFWGRGGFGLWTVDWPIDR